MRAFLAGVLVASLFPAFVQAQPTAAPALDDAAVAAFARQFVASGNAGDCGALERAFDVNAVVERGLQGIALRGSERASLSAAILRQVMTRSVGALAGACVGTANGRRVVYRGRGSIDGRTIARFRISQRAGLNVFVDLELRRGADGTILITDIFQAGAGSWLTEEVRDSSVPMGASDSAFARTLDARGRLIVQNMEAIRQMNGAASAGDTAALDTLVAGLPQALRDDVITLNVRILTAQVGRNMPAYRAAIDDFIRLHPTNVAAMTYAIDQLAFRRNFAGALEAVIQLERRLGPDAFFDLTRAGLLSQLGRRAEAASLALRAANSDPEYVEAWVAALGLCTGEGRHADATRAYQALVRLSAVPPTFATDALYARLRVSPEFRAAVPSTPR